MSICFNILDHLDMCKAVDRGMEIMDVRLLLKDGGKTGLWTREEQGE